MIKFVSSTTNCSIVFVASLQRTFACARGPSRGSPTRWFAVWTTHWSTPRRRRHVSQLAWTSIVSPAVRSSTITSRCSATYATRTDERPVSTFSSSRPRGSTTSRISAWRVRKRPDRRFHEGLRFDFIANLRSNLTEFVIYFIFFPQAKTPASLRETSSHRESALPTTKSPNTRDFTTTPTRNFRFRARLPASWRANWRTNFCADLSCTAVRLSVQRTIAISSISITGLFPTGRRLTSTPRGRSSTTARESELTTRTSARVRRISSRAKSNGYWKSIDALWICSNVLQSPTSCR